MSYHTPEDCTILSWEVDAYFTHSIWGIPKKQVNLGIGYYSFNASGEPIWLNLNKLCPDIAVDVCMCEGVAFASKQMNQKIGELVSSQGFRGVFPWAANYDALCNSTNSLIRYLSRGLGKG